MAHPKVKISDNLGNTVGVTDNKLDVNLEFDPANIDIGDVEILGHGAVAQFTTDILESATQLDEHACKHADIMAKITNVGVVYVGGPSVATTTGVALYPGDVYSVDVTNTNLMWAIAVEDNDDLQVVYYT
tara:strand:- start:225 stop:614 length:390 start_codon:yes stop_codon:yes gene_type:complete